MQKGHRAKVTREARERKQGRTRRAGDEGVEGYGGKREIEHKMKVKSKEMGRQRREKRKQSCREGRINETKRGTETANYGPGMGG